MVTFISQYELNRIKNNLQLSHKCKCTQDAIKIDFILISQLISDVKMLMIHGSQSWCKTVIPGAAALCCYK